MREEEKIIATISDYCTQIDRLCIDLIVYFVLNQFYFYFICIILPTFRSVWR